MEISAKHKAQLSRHLISDKEMQITNKNNLGLCNTLNQVLQLRKPQIYYTILKFYLIAQQLVKLIEIRFH